MKKFIKLGVLMLANSIPMLLSVFFAYNVLLKNSAALTNQIKYDIFLLVLYFLIYFSLMWKDLYSKSYHYYYKFTFRIVVKSLVIAAVAVLTLRLLLFFLIHLPSYNSRYLFAFLLLSAAGFSAVHALEFCWIRHLSALGYFRRRVMLVGKVDKRFRIALYFQDLGDSKVYDGTMTFPNGKCQLEKNNGSLQAYKNFADLLLKRNIGELIIFLTRDFREENLLNLVRFCHKHSISYTLVPDVEKLSHESPWNRPFPYVPAIEIFHTPRDSLTCISLKRLLDMLVSALALLCFVPAGIAIALAIKLEDGGPVFYVSTRIGKNRKPIKFYKFRSMVIDAEKRKKELLQYNERSDGPLFKMQDDPRITKVGRILRKYSLDEVPQLVNVLKGDLSIVGPRPHLPEEVAAYAGTDYLRLECMPGIVCLPQVNGRNSLSFREWVDYDLKYRHNWSNILDVKIMVQAVRVMLEPLMARKDQGY